jgi:hypothetical protein
MARFRSRVVEIEAVQLTRENWGALRELAASSLRGEGLRRLTLAEVYRAFPGAEFDGLDTAHLYATVPTRHGPVLAREGDWIIRGTESELYPCENSVFVRKYEPIVVEFG